MAKSQISSNGDFLRMVSEWFDKKLKSTQQKFHKNKIERATSIIENQDETSWGTIKYYLKQLHNSNKMGFNALLEFASKLANVGLIDNKILRRAEKAYAELKHNDKKFTEWLKKHPSVSSYLSYYFVIAAISFSTWGGIKAANNNNKGDKNEQKKEIVINPEEEDITPEEEKEDENTSEIYDLTDAKFVNDFVEKNWKNIVIGLLELETWRDKPTLHSGEIRYTYGPGITWVYTIDAEGKVHQHPCIGKYRTMADGFSKKQIWEQLRLHLTYKTECVAKIRGAFIEKGVTKASTHQIMGLLFAGYQTPTNGATITKKVIDAKHNKQKQIDAFQYYTGKAKYKNGSMKRRWWCAAYYVGKIDSNDLLVMNRDAFSNSNVNTLLKNGRFQMDEATIQYALALTGPKSTVEQFIIANKVFDLNKKKIKSKQKLTPEQEKENPSVVEMSAGLKAFNAGKYDVAITHYQNAIDIDAYNMEAYSSLSFSYKKLGDKYLEARDIAKAKICYENAIAAVKQGNARMNSNKDLLLDREIKAYLYYNAGQSRDRLGDIYLSENNLESSIYQYDLAAKNYKTAIENAKEVDMDEAIIKTYTTSRKNSLSNKKEVEQLHKTTQKSKKKAAIKAATNSVKSKTHKKQSFANAVMNIKKGRTFDATHLFGSGENIA